MTADLLAALIGANLAAGAAILAVLAARAGLRRAFGARLAYCAWIVVPLAAAASLLPARPQGGAPSMPIRPLAQAAAAQIQVAGEQVQSVFSVLSPSAAGVDAAGALLWLWLAGSLVGVAAVFALQSRAGRLVDRLAAGADGALRARSADLGPAVIGVFAPRIVLPADFEQRFDGPEQAMILAHEQAHLAAHDVRANALIVGARCLFWFNPLVHLAAGLVRQDQELARDETVISHHPQGRRVYAAALLKSQFSQAPLPFGCHWPPSSAQGLKERLTMLRQKTPGRARLTAGAIVIAALSAGTGYAAWAANPQAAAPAVVRAVGPALTIVAAVPDIQVAPAPARVAAAAPLPAIISAETAPAEKPTYNPHTPEDAQQAGVDASVKAIDTASAARRGEVSPAVAAAADEARRQAVLAWWRVIEGDRIMPGDGNTYMLRMGEGMLSIPGPPPQAPPGSPLEAVSRSARAASQLALEATLAFARGTGSRAALDTAEMARLEAVQAYSRQAQSEQAKIDALKPPPVRPTVITHPDWVARPSDPELAAALPVRARRAGREGGAVLNCKVAADGGLARCQVASETAPGLGFGAAALALVPKYRMRTLTADGAPTEGAQISVPVALHLE